MSEVEGRDLQVKSPVNAPPVSQKNQAIKVSKLSGPAASNKQHLPVLIFSPHDIPLHSLITNN